MHIKIQKSIVVVFTWSTFRLYNGLRLIYGLYNIHHAGNTDCQVVATSFEQVVNNL